MPRPDTGPWDLKVQCASCLANLRAFATGVARHYPHRVSGALICFGSLPLRLLRDSAIISTSGQKAEPVSRKSPRASSLPTCAHLEELCASLDKDVWEILPRRESENNHVLRSKAVTRCYLAWGSSPPLSPLLTCSSLLPALFTQVLSHCRPWPLLFPLPGMPFVGSS